MNFSKSSQVEITKVDTDKRMVFGIFSLVNKKGEVLFDRQQDAMDTETIEKAAYDFVLNARVAGEGHTTIGVGDLVESMAFTKEKTEAILKSLEKAGIEDAVMDLQSEFWWGGFLVRDDETLEKIQKGELSMFSIGGSASQREIVEE